MKEKEIEVLKLLPVEDRAKMKEKTIPCGVTLLFLLVGLGIGLYYWFGDELIFEYKTIYPFWGFVIFLLGSILVDIIIAWIYSLFWEDYNNLIKDANNEIEALIKKGDGSPEELHRLKKELIERKIGKETLTKEEFLWHTSNYCWGCGKKHSQPPKRFTVHKERTESWKDGAFRYSKTFSKTGYIDICPDCYSRLMNAKEQDKKNTPLSIATLILLGVGICTGAWFLWGETGLLVSIGIILFGGVYILIYVTSFLLYPFQKHGDTSTKWNFDEIPEIRKFKNQNLPHTH